MTEGFSRSAPAVPFAQTDTSTSGSLHGADSTGKYWAAFAALAVFLIVAAAIWWSRAHPFGIHWDEAEYLNDAQIDAQRLHSGAILKLGGRILIKSWGRPPVFRIIALPFLCLFGPTMMVARLVSLSCFLASALFLYLATRRVASQLAAAFAVLIFALSPEVVSASLFFGTDAPLYLAVSALFYYMFVAWTETAQLPNTWIGVGLAIGFGSLAKTSFAAIVVPVLLFWWVTGRYGNWGIPRLEAQWKAGALAVVVAVPWWILNLKASMAYAQYARGFVRNSLGSPSLGTWARWLSTAIQSLLGYGVAILVVLVVVAYYRQRFVFPGSTLAPLHKAVLGVCAAGGVPIVLAQLSGTNHLLRHVTPAVIPLAIATGVLADAASWGIAGISVAVSSALFAAQLAMLLAPLFAPNREPVHLGFVNGSLPWQVMARFDQWDWRPVLDLSRACAAGSPKISYLGNGRAFNDPQIRHPFVDQQVPADVTWLWRYEEGPLDWTKVMAVADQSDVVVTAPNFFGEAKYKEDLDNQHNSEFAGRLLRDSHFRAPVRMEMGRFQPVEVLVFLNNSLACPVGPQVPVQ